MIDKEAHMMKKKMKKGGINEKRKGNNEVATVK